MGYGNPLVYIFSGTLDLGLATQKIRLIQKALSDRCLEVSLYTSLEPVGDRGRSQAAQIKQLCRQRPRAILCAVQLLDPEVFPELETYQREGGIVISYDIPIPLPCDQVIFDREHNAYQAARYLLERGHRRIGIGISKQQARPLDGPGAPQAYRLQGFRRALREFGAPFQPEWLFENPPYEEGGEEMARRFLQLSERPTGLCIVNDTVAFTFMIDVIRAGIRIPEDVSVVGHDNLPIAARCPVPMTSAAQPAEVIAQAVVEMLLERTNGYDGPPRTVTLRGSLAERESVTTPPPT